MKAIATAVCVVLSTTSCLWAQVEFKKSDDHVAIFINGQPFSDFFIGSTYGKPFLAPLRSATGLIVSRRYPMESVEGESRDHPHHRGLWIGYGDVNGVNFWENDPASHTSAGNPSVKGTILLRTLDDLSPGNKAGHVRATFGWQAPGHGDILEEHRTMTFYAEPDVRTIDIDVTFVAKVKVRFGDTKEGFFAIRVADSMTEKSGGLITNSEGAQTERNVWGRRADWVDYDGAVDGQKVGIVIFDNPHNFEHPPRWHVRAYGLFAVNPFGGKDFEPNGRAEGGTTLEAGQSMRLRYRVMIHRGDVPMKKLANWYADYWKKVK